MGDRVPFAELFQQIVLSPDLQRRIYKDIGAVLEAFPSLKEYNLPAGNCRVIAVYGRVPLASDDECNREVVLNFALYFKDQYFYPQVPPTLEILPPRDGVLLDSEHPALKADGHVDWDQVMQWSPPRSTFVDAVRALLRCFLIRPPYDSPIRRQRAAQAQYQAAIRAVKEQTERREVTAETFAREVERMSQRYFRDVLALRFQ